MIGIITALGRWVLNCLQHLGRIFMLFGRTLYWTGKPPYNGKEIVANMVHIGYDSLPISVITSAFSGMVFAIHITYGLERFGAKVYVGSLVGQAIVREVGPVMCSIVVGGRVGASIAAQFGTMKVTEQIDAMNALAVDPIKYLVVPRFIASMVMLPVLTVIADFIGIAGGWLIAVTQLGMESRMYIDGVIEYVEPKDLISGMIKALFFGIIIVMIGSYCGFRTKGGAQGVGKATTRAIVGIAITVLIVDYFLSLVFYYIKW